MRFPYRKQPNFLNPQQPWITRPVIPVCLFHHGQQVQVEALIDSGADATLFHSSIGKVLGIDLEAGRRTRFFGVSGDPIDVYFHPVQLQVVGAGEPVEMEVGFTNARGVAALLGQTGFFDHFRVTFERDKEQVEVTPLR